MATAAPHRPPTPDPPGGLRVLADDATPDRVLVALAGRGDEQAFELFYARHRRPVYAYALRMLCDHARAEDVVQEVFVSAIRAMYDGERPRHARAWLHEIARRVCIDQWRGVTRRGEVSYDAPEGLSLHDADRLAGGEDSVMRAAVDREAMETLRRAFADLPELQHTVLVQRELEGRSPHEIAQRLGISRTVVEGQLARGRRTLAQAYRELQSGERCRATRALSEASVQCGIGVRDRQRLGSHLRHCAPCRQHARALGVHPRFLEHPVVARVAALFPLPLLRRWWPFDTTFTGEAASGAVSGKVLVGAAVLAAGSGGAFVAGNPVPNPFASHRAPVTSSAPSPPETGGSLGNGLQGTYVAAALGTEPAPHRVITVVKPPPAEPARRGPKPLVVKAVPRPSSPSSAVSRKDRDAKPAVTAAPAPSSPAPTRTPPVRTGPAPSTPQTPADPGAIGDAAVVAVAASPSETADPPVSTDEPEPEVPPADTGDGTTPADDGSGEGSTPPPTTTEPPADEPPTTPEGQPQPTLAPAALETSTEGADRGV